MPNQYTPKTSTTRICPGCGRTFVAEPNEIRRGRGKYCSFGCAVSARGDRRSLPERFWAKVDRSNREGCWLWRGAVNNRGYGQITVRNPLTGKHDRKSAHRVSYELHHGTIPAGLSVCHSCDTPGCVAPHHLFADTHLANMHDMWTKGRNGERTKPGRKSRGERNGLAKLTDARVVEIRRLHRDFGLSLAVIARRYGLAKSTIAGVVARKSWRHVP